VSIKVVMNIINNEFSLNFRLHCVCAIIGLMLFHLFTFDWPFLPSDLKTYTQQGKLHSPNLMFKNTTNEILNV
jgi:hypothetical protein